MNTILNYKMVISYVGDNFKGWQVQKNHKTVQQEIENILERIYKKRIILRYSSRTDSGVHAYCQVASFKAENKLTVLKLQMALNTQIDKDIVVKSIEIVNDNFDARKSKYKEYKYLIDTGGIRNPFRKNRFWRVRYVLDIEIIKQGVKLFIGKKDFRSFMAVDGEAKTTVREVYDFYLTQYDDKLEFTIKADGFLKQMVRNIIGTVLDLGRGRFKIEDIDNIFKAKDRAKAGTTAPAYGLYLNKVFYE